ncbi:MAG: valine--tRNA ligase [Bacteroidia bacterium]|nr:valine--tRNA ligase [Bacteroidia bacterium]MCO5253776.1 valine--tRNA ligase [Bacteroidota bacterium]MCZ2130796.1 valine--tRNA ligase [Bacteroidia bacterium]
MDSKHYNPALVEDKWYEYWLTHGYFSSVPDEREPYTIVIPPPNVTGVLHMGHMLNNTIQDVLIRKARMEGKNACWVPGTDHASIATEAKVVAMLKEQGINKTDISRDDFLKHAWAWKEKYGGIILEQLKKLGASCDWTRTRFTMEEDLSKAVIHVFIDLYKKGLIYRDTKMVNWDPEGKTTLSDEEVVYKEANSALYHIKYKIIDSDESLIIATTRPETLLGDTAVCVHPDDERYKQWIGKFVEVPLVNRQIPIIADEYVDKEFGTGCLKVTPAHDINDYNLGKKYKLDTIEMLDESGKVKYVALRYNGMDRFDARKEVVKDLKEQELLVEIKNISNSIGHSERTGAVIESRISTQWFLNMQKFMERNPQVLDAVMNDEITFFPDKFKNTYKHWIDNIKDWNISRQLWWGHRIPAWYDTDGNFVVADNEENAQEVYKQKFGKTARLSQDEDVLDTWFSSWLWPISVFNGFEPNSKDFQYYYPTSDLVTGPDIIFFWVARMVMAGYEFAGQKPFKNVYFTGIVRDKQRRKMSKSLGNSPDPLDLIKQFGADGTRMGILLSAPAGNDVLFDEALVEQGRNFCNKIWNAFKLMDSWQVDANVAHEIKTSDKVAAAWFEVRLQQAVNHAHEYFKQYKLSDALMTLYKLTWDDFCSQYLEMVKPKFGEGIDAQTKHTTLTLFAELLKLLHPFMPFITEELYQQLQNIVPSTQSEALIVSAYPQPSPLVQTADNRPLALISEIRNIRNAKGIPAKEPLHIVIHSNDALIYQEFALIIRKLAGVETMTFGKVYSAQAIVFLVDKDEIAVEMEGLLNVEAEKENLLKEIDYLQGFLQSVNAKLNNERFVANAKAEIVEKERQKQADAESKLKSLQDAVAKLK